MTVEKTNYGYVVHFSPEEFSTLREMIWEKIPT